MESVFMVSSLVPPMPLFSCDAHPASNAATPKAVSNFFIYPFLIQNLISLTPQAGLAPRLWSVRPTGDAAIPIALTRRSVIVVAVVVRAAGRLQIALGFQCDVVHHLSHTFGPAG